MSVLKEFKAFVMRGNLLELAVAFVMGVAFAGVVSAFTDGIIGGIIAAIVGEPSFGSIGVTINDGFIAIGSFLQAMLNFVIVAWVLFLIIRAFNRLRPKEEPAATTHPCPFCKTDIALDASRCPNCTSQLG
ncbi:MAG TPA: large conductance mechanosensitive channel protein MscL [Actinomycetota bacterium]|jgi:large conductance mechanosensitive channel|nr:large conductance mechanosensitive channel protein MscL [Actinomycetota bacterium]